MWLCKPLWCDCQMTDVNWYCEIRIDINYYSLLPSSRPVFPHQMFICSLRTLPGCSTLRDGLASWEVQEMHSKCCTSRRETGSYGSGTAMMSLRSPFGRTRFHPVQCSYVAVPRRGCAPTRACDAMCSDDSDDWDLSLADHESHETRHFVADFHERVLLKLWSMCFDGIHYHRCCI